MGNRLSAVGDTRILWVGGDYGPSSKPQFRNNRIVTSKYTIWSFLPKNLFEQFRRIANFYFLCMTVISLTIESPVEPLTSVLPLMFVIAVTALKQSYEDWLRHRSDNEVNCALVTVIRKGIVQDIKAKDVHVGDLVRIMSDADVPCDLVLLSSSNSDGRCYVTTANLDGETNLKTLVCPRILRNLSQPGQLTRLKAQIECEQPTPDLYKFFGKIEIFPNEANTWDANSPLEHTSIKSVRSSQHAYDFDGIALQTMSASSADITLQQYCIDNDITLRRASILDGNVPTNHNRDSSSHRTRMDRGIHLQCINSVPLDVTSFINEHAAVNQRSSVGGAAARKTTQEGCDEIQNVECIVDAVVADPDLSKSNINRNGPSFKEQASKSSLITGDVNFIQTEADEATSSQTCGSNVNSVMLRETVKRSIVSKQESVLETRLGAGQFDSEFQDTNSSPLGTENLLLRGARLKNTEFVIGCAVYTGQETKLALNSKLTSNKFSTVEKSINSFLLFFLGLLLTEVAVSLAFKYAVEIDGKYSTESYLGEKNDINVSAVLQDLFSFVIIYNYIIPISLYVTIETQKFIGSLFLTWDIELYCEKTNQPAICNTSDLNEELGQVEYLFTDKTGTLTENTMWFRRCSIAGIPYLEDRGKMFQLLADGDERNSIILDTFTPEMEHFLLALALCHSVQVGIGKGHTNNNTNANPIASLDYQASSPDEKALVEASARCGVVFLGEEGDSMSVMMKGRVCHYRKLNTLEFTSDRKRMSVVVQDEDGQIWLYCKGAESSVIPLTDAGPVNDTLQHIADFAMRGLRTLIVCYKKLSVKEYSKLAAQVEQSRQTLSSQRVSIIAASYDKMESSLTLLGATGVEDQLQEGVQETLESLRAAGIKVWILTGDKVETAVNISFSCGHLKPGAQQLYLTGHKSKESCLQTLQIHRNQVSRERLEHYGLVVDGQSLYFALNTSDNHLEAFQDICRACTAVICCRMSPLQKCQVVQLVKGFPEKPITAAIGDGANDVSMIQEAHVGLGIMGKEGRQAVRSSDFAFARFKFLRRILFVHGHWYYIRVATLVQYFFYKNIVFITPQVYYAFSNGFSTQPLYDTMFLTCYNVLFTSLPILIYGLFEQNHPAQTLLDYPQVYKNIRRNVLMSWSSFFQWITFGVWHSVVLYFVPYFMLLDNPVVFFSNTPMEMIAFGTFIFHCVVCVANLKLVLKSHYWTWLFLGSALLVTICGFILVTAIYSIVTTTSMAYVYPVLLGSCTFWLLSLILMLACLVPDCIFSVLQNYTPAAYAKLQKSWKGFGKKKYNHYSLNRSDVQRSSSRHESVSFNSLNVQRLSCS
ncbi:probable phospholipid-transporting ATPase IF isoform X4 [Zootermopsis nevadensis]|uniref:probable phospholipid-transporting ATPase IF isoform X4 n=1 Tax=Zootermopsis nevadensis TaxID=136037 RepID=UPI000B8E3F6B|nr:probable phospholipid-transporting ATPase IF isoform X4 [Zootermopsis nevadensis]XP_021935484.1 probable phospholipid-transporting ATPase IF isoform X4 [Zootermopsis nevadensis]